MSKYLMALLPNDLLTMVDEYLMPSKEHMRLLFDKVVCDVNIVVDTLPLSEIFLFIKFGLCPPVLKRSYGYYSLHHYLH
jgi:hypothetical protein